MNTYTSVHKKSFAFANPQPQLLFITHQTSKYDFLQSAQIALDGGCRCIQLRMKEIPLKMVGKTAQSLKLLCESYQAELYIDDHVDICKDVDATGVHLGKNDMSPVDARQILGDKFIIGGTANTFEDIVNLQLQGVDYIGLGPFRFTTTKKNLSPILGLEGYRQIITQCRHHHIGLPILAIGGINGEDIPSIIETEVAGIALSSTILSANDPIAETQKILHLITQQ